MRWSTSFIGGATDPQAVEMPGELSSIVHKEIAAVLKIRTEPAFSNVAIYPKAIPQYNCGSHGERLAAIDEARKKHSNLWLIGNYLRGPAIGACVEQSLSTSPKKSFAVEKR